MTGLTGGLTASGWAVNGSSEDAGGGGGTDGICADVNNADPGTVGVCAPVVGAGDFFEGMILSEMIGKS